MIRLFFSILQREFLISLRSGADSLTVFFFFLSFMALSSFFLQSLSWIGFELPLVLGWVLCLSTYFLSIERYYSRDLDDGTYEFYFSLSTPFSFFLFMKGFSHWIFHGIPLSLASFFLFLFYSIPTQLVFFLPFTFFMGTFLLSQISTLGFCLTSKLKYRGALLSFLLLPLSFPIIILCIMSVFSFLNGTPFLSFFQIYLGALLFVSILTSFFSSYILLSSFQT
uniref:ABC transporter channel subunit n=1 Tax=Andalucia godoyi TaxID=505711 RepID=M4Q9G5_ANDGO|nr:ABC transporter channel subunit [Andalucia godoyi]AGH24006.1 ABC transporter channel subunit [Andalucia godoyi]